MEIVSVPVRGECVLEESTCARIVAFVKRDDTESLPGEWKVRPKGDDAFEELPRPTNVASLHGPPSPEEKRPGEAVAVAETLIELHRVVGGTYCSVVLALRAGEIRCRLEDASAQPIVTF